jgi:hypothetical protein
LIKWLSLDEAEDLVNSGVEVLDMIPEERTIWDRRISLLKRTKI